MLAVVHLGSGDSSMEASNRSRPRCRQPRYAKLLKLLINAASSPHNITTLIPPNHWDDPYFDTRAYNFCSHVAQLEWSDGKSRPLRLRSLCPWILVTPHRRNDRFPRRISEARCICRRCQLKESTHQCRPIYYPMIVLQKTDRCNERNVTIYKPARHLVAVGCTCVNASQS